jgi:hypothetical protein
MKVVSDKNIRVTTLGGTAILFEAGVPRDIAEEIGLLAVQMGAKEFNKQPAVEPSQISEETPQAEEASNELVTFLEKLMDEGDPKNFKTDGYPKAAVINKAMGRTVGSDEREQAWELILNS